MKARATLPISALLLALGAACYDPVHSDNVDSLGDEAPGVPEGPLHRPGQQCTTCHGGVGPGSPTFSIAGTIYALQGQPQPAVGVQVTITDKIGSRALAVTNEAGNFYIDKDEWDPIFPVHVEVAGAKRQMETTIGRDGGCGACHRGTGNSQYQPAVWLNP